MEQAEKTSWWVVTLFWGRFVPFKGSFNMTEHHGGFGETGGGVAGCFI